jgi:hypothetical protein
MLLPASGKFNGNDHEASLTENLCYRYREINPFPAP